jgi:tRNA (cytidine/uridine-2'-O-)-methyltransferase
LLNIVLVEPEIPQNTGNIARTAAALGARLHLVKPLGFSLADRYLKRAGLDYWSQLELKVHQDMASLWEELSIEAAFFCSTKAPASYTAVNYPEDCSLVFGKETAGLPESLLREHLERTVRIPMRREARSLNLSNAVAIVAYEAMRQRDFPGLKEAGIFAPGEV